MTDIEKLMSKILGELGFRFEYQYEMPPYIVDFYLPEFKIVIESDGSMWHSRMGDRKRDLALMKKYGVRLMHFLDYQIKTYPEGIKGSILKEIEITKYQSETKERLNGN